MTVYRRVEGAGSDLVAYYPDSYRAGRYRVVRELAASGGQGYVLLVEDTWSGGHLILKGMWWSKGRLQSARTAPAEIGRINSKVFAGLGVLRDITQYTQQAPALVDAFQEISPTLCHVVDPSTDLPETFVVQQLVGNAGQGAPTLAEHLAQRRREQNWLDRQELIDLADQLCSALAALHRRRVVPGGPGRRNTTTYWIHADVKPQNVLVLGPPWRYMLIDYDGAVAVGEKVGASTPGYAPPPRLSGAPGWAEGDEADEKFDVYMLGTTLLHAAGLEQFPPRLLHALYYWDGRASTEYRDALEAIDRLGHGPVVSRLLRACVAAPAFRLREVRHVRQEIARARDAAAVLDVLRPGRGRATRRTPPRRASGGRPAGSRSRSYRSSSGGPGAGPDARRQEDNP